MALPATPASRPKEKTPWQKVARRTRVPLGFVFTIAFLVFARPTWLSLGISFPFVAAGLGLRAYAAGYLSKNKQLATTGPYAYVRNPLYLGTALLAVGFGLSSMQPMIGLGIVAMFLAIYLPTIASEERYLRNKFSDFDAYAESVPRLLPRLTPARLGGEGGFARAVYLKNREYQALMGSVAIYAALIVRILFVELHR